MLTRDLSLEVGDVEEVAAVVRDHRVHQRHVARRARPEPPRDVAADEAEAAGDQDALPAKAARASASTVPRIRIAASAHVDRGRAAAADAPLARRPRARARDLLPHDQLPPEPAHAARRPRDAREVEELRAAVHAVVVVHRDVRDAEAVLLDLGHQLDADQPGVAGQLDALEDARGGSAGSRSRRRGSSARRRASRPSGRRCRPGSGRRRPGCCR